MSLPPCDWPHEAVLEYDPAREPQVAWEDPNRPTLAALLATVGRILWQPRRFFSELPSGGGLGEPLSFALLVGTLGMLSTLFWQLLQEGNFSEVLPLGLAQYADNVMDNPGVLVGVFLLLPLLVVLGQFWFSLCLFWAVRLIGPPQTTFESAFRVAAYAQAPAVLCLVPWGGALVAGIWNLILLVIAVARKFDFSTIKAVFALFLASFFQGMLLAGLLGFVGLLGLWRLFFG